MNANRYPGVTVQEPLSRPREAFAMAEKKPVLVPPDGGGKSYLLTSQILHLLLTNMTDRVARVVAVLPDEPEGSGPEGEVVEAILWINDVPSDLRRQLTVMTLDMVSATAHIARGENFPDA